MNVLEIPGVESFATLLSSKVRSVSAPKLDQYPRAKDLQVDNLTSIVCSPYYRTLALYRKYQEKESLAQFLIRCKASKHTDKDLHLKPQVYFSAGSHTLDQTKLLDKFPQLTYNEYMTNLAGYLPLYNSEALRLVESVYEEDFDQLGYVQWTAFSIISLQSVIQQKMVFISAQPDELYFHWQTEIYTYAFSRMGLQDRIIVLFGIKDKPSARALDLAKYFRVFFYKDTREDVSYLPSIAPHLLKQYFKEYAQSCVFYHDADIVFTRLPAFEEMVGHSYLSNTISYIGGKYLKECGERFSEVYSTVAPMDLLEGMCKVIGISPLVVQQKEKEAGGAQYLLHNLDSSFWEKVEADGVALHTYMVQFQTKYPISHGVQSWCAGMWAVLWNCWLRGISTPLHKELDFSWATNTTADYYRLPIFHLAGITGTNQEGKFFKALYSDKDPIQEYFNKPELLDKIDRSSATYIYVELMCDYAQYKQQRDLFVSLGAPKILPRLVTPPAEESSYFRLVNLLTASIRSASLVRVCLG